MLSPVAPHIAEELWESLVIKSHYVSGMAGIMTKQNLWTNEVEVVVQINGKVRAKLTVPSVNFKRKNGRDGYE